MGKVAAIEIDDEVETYDIWNYDVNAYLGQGNFVIDGLVVHNSILANGVRVFDDLLLFNAMGHPGPMQCCCSHSKINIETGSKPIKDLDPESDSIQCLSNNSTIITTNQYKVVNSGRKKLLKITLANGKELYVTKDHKILTDNGYIQAGDLVSGQNIAICKRSEQDS